MGADDVVHHQQNEKPEPNPAAYPLSFIAVLEDGCEAMPGERQIFAIYDMGR
ncbi:hypothetical protein [Neorhizobium petrolearium]|uniref:hypothetical protein n=1 Tax=Neorhizobium petrolearium TaxID=515361 RepID=UPI003F7F4335